MKRLAIVLVLMLSAGVVSAQQYCGGGLPCGPLPWPLPAYPELQTPTPMPTIAITVQATNVVGGIATPPAVPTNPVISTVDTSQISDAAATLQSVVAQTPMSITDLDGTPVDTDQTFTDLADNAGTFFGYAKSVSNDQFGALSPLFTFTFVAFLTVVSIKLLTFTLPFAIAIFGLIRKIISLVLDFLPL